MGPRKVAEALDKNYHTTRCLLCKMEAAGSIQHVKSHYVALPGENSRNQRNQCHHRNQRNQSVPSVLQLDGQITRGGEPCLPAIDYSDGSDYAHVNVSANGSQTHGIPPPLAGCAGYLVHPFVKWTVLVLISPFFSQLSFFTDEEVQEYFAYLHAFSESHPLPQRRWQRERFFQALQKRHGAHGMRNEMQRGCKSAS